MGDSKIEWTNKTWNPIRGCSVVSEGCRNCYAMNFAARFAQQGEPYEGLAYRNESGAHWTGKVRLIEEHLEDPLRWRKPRMIFVNSMSDLFHEALSDHDIARVVSVMWAADHHAYQILTKRPDRMMRWASEYEKKLRDANRRPLSGWRHVWLGVSVEDQKTADERIPLLLQTSAAVRWISAEPLLGPVDLTRYFARDWTLRGHNHPTERTTGIDWIVAGGESGPKARPMHPDWARSLRDQCVAAGVPYFFKQWGEYSTTEQQECSHISSDGAQGPVVKLTPQRVDVWRCNLCSALHGYFPGDKSFDFKRVGKKAAGRLLDGREWSEYPKTAA
jgi:protein gp37